MQEPNEKRTLPGGDPAQREEKKETDARAREKTAAIDDRPAQAKRNWITDIYDKINVSVHTLDIMIVALCLLIVFLFVFGNRIKLGF